MICNQFINQKVNHIKEKTMLHEQNGAHSKSFTISECSKGHLFHTDKYKNNV